MIKKRKKGALVLQDGTRYEGYLFGCEKAVSGEVVFSTAMTGYTESLSDPSYEGQILVSTFPLVGNYGLPDDSIDPTTGLTTLRESKRLHPLAFIVHDYTDEYSHWDAKQSLEEGMKESGMAGLFGIDTRALTQKLRDQGPLLGKVVIDGDDDIPFKSSDEENLVAHVSINEPVHYGNNSADAKRVILLDCGCKENIIRHLLNYGLNVTMVPWNYDFTKLEYNGLFISNGPGNPNMCGEAVEHIRKALLDNKPTAGICMGNQLLALAIGAKVVKMKYGHRSHNQPVQLVGTTNCYITSQNHGFAVDSTTLPKGWRPYFVNLNDGTNEGLMHESGRFYSVQFHPEAASGPTDTTFIFEDFVKLMNK